jgi:hypothetical protein
VLQAGHGRPSSAVSTARRRRASATRGWRSRSAPGAGCSANVEY